MADKKHKKKKPKSVEELTKGFEEFAKTHELKDINKADFEKTLDKVMKHKPQK
jgi:hypothetical protein